MKDLKLSLLLFFIIGIWGAANSQNSLPEAFAWDTDYSDCAAIIYNGKMLVDEYSPNGKCKLEQGMKGKLSLSTVQLSDKGGIPVRSLKFQIAIKNDKTNTMWMYSKGPLTEVNLEDVLKECKKDDRIIFLTTDKKIALTHHEIEIVRGC